MELKNKEIELRKRLILLLSSEESELSNNTLSEIIQELSLFRHELVNQNAGSNNIFTDDEVIDLNNLDFYDNAKLSDNKYFKFKSAQQINFTNALNEVAEIINSINNSKEILASINRIIGQVLNIDETVIYEIDYDYKNISCLCKWLKDDSIEITPTLGIFSLPEIFEESLNSIKDSAKPFLSHFNNINNLLLSKDGYKILHEDLHIKNLLWYPFAFSEDGFYLLTISQIFEDRTWEIEELNFLQSITMQISIALMRIQLINRQNQAKNELINSERNYREIFNSSTESIFIDDAATGKMIDVNLAMLQMYGYDNKEEVLNANIGDLSANIEPYTNKMALNYIKKTINEGPQTFEWLAKRKDGSTFWVEMTLKKTQIGGDDRIIAVGRDINNRKIIEEKLKESEEKYRALVENSLESIVILELDGTIIFANSAMAKTFEFPNSDKMKNINVIELLAPESVALAMHDFAEVKEGNDAFISCYKCYTMTGKEIWIESIGKVINYEGRVVDLLSLRDISEKTLNEKALYESKELFKSVVENSSNLNIMTTPKGIITFISPQCEKVLGYSGKDIIDEIFPNFIIEQDKEKCKAAWEAVYLKNESILDFEYRIIDKQNEIRWISHSAQSIRIDNEIIAFQNTFQNISERKKSETALKESETLLRSLIDNAPFEVWARDNNDVGILENQLVKGHYGSILGTTPSDTASNQSDFDAKIWDDNNKRVHSGEIVNEECTYFINNEARIFQQIVFPIINDSIVKGIAGFNIDVTEKKLSEERMTKLTNCLLGFGKDASLNINSLVGLCGEILGADYALYNRIDGNNLSSVGFWQIPADYKLVRPLEGQICSDVINNNSKEPIIIKNLSSSQYARTDINISSSLIETYAGIAVKLRDTSIGTLCLLYKNNKDFRGSELEFMRIVSFAISIEEERNQAENSLIKSYLRNKALLDAIPDMMFVFDKDGNIIDYNVHEENSLYMSADDFLNKNIMQAFPNELGNSTLKKIKSVLDNKKLEILCYSLDFEGVTKYFESRYVLQGIDEVLGIVREITDRVIVEQQLIKAKEKAEESEKLKSAFLANMSHEIRTPMNGILGFARLLKESDLNEDEASEFIDLITKSGKRMLNIINDIIDISKIEAGQMEINICEMNIIEQINDAFFFFKPEADEKKLQIFIDIPKNEEIVTVLTDKDKIFAVLLNLTKNAIKFTNLGFIQIGYTIKDNNVLFYVTDTGVGIDYSLHHIIFERFRQGSEALSRNYEGAGLGLSISKAYIEMLGGKLWVESIIGKGSTFYFTIPLNNSKEDIQLANNENESVRISAPKNIKPLILIAEDDDVSANLLKTIFKRADCAFIQAFDGVKAVEMCRNNPDLSLIMMDIKMPMMNGYDAIREIRKFNKDVKIIAQTAYALSGDKEKAIEAGADEYLSKPIGLNTIMRIIHDL